MVMERVTLTVAFDLNAVELGRISFLVHVLPNQVKRERGKQRQKESEQQRAVRGVL